MKHVNGTGILIALLFLAATSVSGQTLWQNAKVGMTPEQVKVAFPEAKWDKEGKALRQTTTIVDQLWDVYFEFTTDSTSRKLKKVKLQLHDKTLHEVKVSDIRRRMITALQAKYGMVLDAPPTKGWISMQETAWLTKDKVSVVLRMFTTTGRGKSISGLAVTYSMESKEAADKL